ncbi:ACP S-malonyltransferase [Rubrobacter radiotolerans]|uniref:[acyl-carrier-protein] S-malonyltransferase n=1 Tax=Rubrobacter radiotolerans TaxID=42256 RepID=A0AB35T6Z8_RUBRA|nr:ACP S-malonyltransferase [Rubrobacter radiotolerans]MDX5895327.1 ACP S-malonyltransferase [Rubrobacter radiotolerans]SMC01646.1 [acyl-carrier-protein] S-malonyltransferase [Rubrobacter radiotolerans DSM 5868]
MTDQRSEKYAVLFPPQVYVRPGEYRDLHDHYDAVRTRFADAAEAVGFDLAAAFFSDDPDEVNRGTVARPAIVALSTALHEIVRDGDAPPAFTMGLSLGQITAAHVGGCLSFHDAARMAHEMAAIEEEAFGSGEYGVHFFYNVVHSELLRSMEALKAQGHRLWPCAFTGDNQMIVTGARASLEQLSREALILGGMGVVIPYGPPAHCPLMREVELRFRERWRYAEEPRQPDTPLVCNLTSEVLATAEEIHWALVRQYTSAVRWSRSVRRLAELGVNRLVVMGPGHFVRKSLPFVSVSFETECVEGTQDLTAMSNTGRGGAT